MDEKPSDAQITNVVQIGLSALKNAILINGAACIAVFTLLGHVATSEKARMPLASFGRPLIIFAAGVFVAALASGTAFFAEGFAIHAQDSRSKVLGWTTLGLVILSFVLFLLGSFFTYDAIVNRVEVIYPR